MEKIAEGLWGCETDLRLPGGVIFRSRMTALDLGDGELVLHSPVALDDERVAALRELGDVRYIVAPNDFHHVFAGPASELFPDAMVLTGAGVRKKQPRLRVDHAIEDGAPSGWGDRLRPVFLAGSKIWNETVLVHEPSGTLLCADLVFNIQKAANLRTKLVLMLVGADGKFAQSRSEKYLFVRDRDRFAESLAELMSCSFDRIVMCHGDVVESGGYAKLADAVSWAYTPAVGALPA